MAVTVTTLRQGQYSAEFAVEMTADGDTLANFVHGLTGTPNVVTITPLKPEAYVGSYTLGAITATNVQVNKTTAAGSGVAGAAVRVCVQVTHSIQQ